LTSANPLHVREDTQLLLLSVLYYLHFDILAGNTTGIFAGVPFMGIPGFIPGAMHIVYALTGKNTRRRGLKFKEPVFPGRFCDNRGNQSKSGIREPGIDSYEIFVHGLPGLKHRKSCLIQISPLILQHRAGCIYLPSL
jgi:hypothetical protein